jgi:Skp family chaperone for outer membrane proteins
MKVAICAAAAAALLIGGVCQAQDGKFAFVDFQKFAGMSQKAKDQQKKFGEMVDAKRASLEKLQKDFVDLQEQLKKQGPMLKEETRNQKLKEIGIKEMELKLAEKEAQNVVQNAQREFQEIFRQDISKVIATIRAEKHYSAIFDAAAILSADDAMDITKEVADRYDAEAGAAKAPVHKPKAPAAAPKPKQAK